MPVTPEYDANKLKQLILYVAEQLLEDRHGGATKLNKVLFFADFAHMRMHGRPITGVPYQKLEHGPAPRTLTSISAELVRDKQATLKREAFLGYKFERFERFVPLVPADLSVFEPDEIDTVNQVIADLAGFTARQVSDLSHEEFGWQMVDYNETIPYATAGLRKAELTPSIEAHARLLAIELGAAAS